MKLIFHENTDNLARAACVMLFACATGLVVI